MIDLYYRNVYLDAPDHDPGFCYGGTQFSRKHLAEVRCKKWKFIGIETIAGAYGGGRYTVVFFEPKAKS